MRLALAAFLFLILPALAGAEPIEPSAIQVRDGDTIEARGRVVQLVGFDAPETADRARCEAERTLGIHAAERLRLLIHTAARLDLTLVRCSCRPGTEGTWLCNRRRACGVLTIGGQDVGPVLIAEGLARRYVCRSYSCPRRTAWC
jgi:endonuclease YncB( thermonuclease family)